MSPSASSRIRASREKCESHEPRVAPMPETTAPPLFLELIEDGAEHSNKTIMLIEIV